MEGFYHDLPLIVCLCAFGVLAVLAAYALGRSTWKTRFMIRIEQPGKKGRAVPGQLGEVASLGMVCILLILVDYFTPNAFVLDLLQEHSIYAWIVGSALAVGIVAYSLSVCAKVRSKEEREPEYCGELLRGYLVYNGYSLVMYSFITLMVALISWQFFMQAQQIQASNNGIQAIFAAFQDLADPSWQIASSYSEVIYGRTLVGSSIIMSQIGTLLLIIFSVFLAYFAITFTPLSQVYEKGAVRSVHVAFLGSLVFVGVLAWIIYFTTYASFFDRSLAQLETFRPLVETGDAESISLYNTLMLDLHKHRGPTGFILTLTNESGWLVILIAAVRWLLGRKAAMDNKASTEKIADETA